MNGFDPELFTRDWVQNEQVFSAEAKCAAKLLGLLSSSSPKSDPKGFCILQIFACWRCRGCRRSVQPVKHNAHFTA
eukprot:1159115-Pelagomonas_calceolata.AAC.3